MEPRIKVFPNSGGRLRLPEPPHETAGSRKTRRRGTSPKPHPTEHEGESPRGGLRRHRASAKRVSGGGRRVSANLDPDGTAAPCSAPYFPKPGSEEAAKPRAIRRREKPRRTGWGSRTEPLWRRGPLSRTPLRVGRRWSASRFPTNSAEGAHVFGGWIV